MFTDRPQDACLPRSLLCSCVGVSRDRLANWMSGPSASLRQKVLRLREAPPVIGNEVLITSPII